MFETLGFRKTSSRLHGKIVALEMNEETLVEIDSLTDWKIVDFCAEIKFSDSLCRRSKLIISDFLISSYFFSKEINLLPFTSLIIYLINSPEKNPIDFGTG